MGSGLVIPSYAQGFARNAAEAANPGLWNGLVGLWQPTLGPTGASLFDISGRGHHGILTTMTLANAWIMTNEGAALAFAGGTEHVVLDATALNLNVDVSPFSVHIRYRTIDAGTGSQYMASNTSANRCLRVNWEYPAQLIADFGMDVDNYAGVNGADGAWHSDAYNCWDNGGGGTIHAYRDGIYRAVKVATSGGCTFPLNYIGRCGASYGIFDLGLLAGWERTLTPHEHQLLHRDPHAIVRPLQRLPGAVTPGGVPPFCIHEMLHGSQIGANTYNGMLL